MERIIIPMTDEQYEDLLLFQELEQERKTADWEAPFPMTARTQRDMAENEARIVREGIARFRAFLYADGQAQMNSSPF